MGMAYDDFCRLTFGEFDAVAGQWSRMRENDLKDNWERTRLAAAIVIQPHLRKRIQPKRLLPLPWDKATARKGPERSPQQNRERFELLRRKYEHPETGANDIKTSK
ncbi:MAG: hypothetical protein LUC33_00245 [Prevotellaceae bacterium]|nr:hypothetical protein [Prevotellaceae bacterium]